ncbi:uncharacterized protein [Typha angustifolia]|uniref:uncharacterized protein n=1 Tax=Typha angustifolia TaxID=59011 RepID=UPI003C2F9DE2
MHMENSDLYESVVRQIRTSGNLKSNLSGSSNASNSPSFRKLNPSRTHRRESKGIVGTFKWIQSNRVVFWLILITLWAYIGFLVQSQWAHSDHGKAYFGAYKSEIGGTRIWEEDKRRDAASGRINATTSSGKKLVVVDGSDSRKYGVHLMEKGIRFQSHPTASKKKIKDPEHRLSKKAPVKARTAVAENTTGAVEEGIIPKKNTSYGLIVGPFGKAEDTILGWNADKRKGTCDRKGDFARIVWSRSFVLIIHELSMTGAPLSMMELATEILSCGGSVSAVVLIRKGGLMTELEKRGIKVLKDKAELSFKTAMKADLVIAGSAVCSSWIEQYLLHFPAGSGKIVWWIMENRREYFDRSRHLLNRVKILTFLSDSQSKEWLSWCEEEKIQLSSQPMLVPLSVNDELAFVAGIPCSLNTLEFSVEKMVEKRNLLRNAVRKEMGLGDNDVLIMSLSSITTGKGQRLFLESALLAVEHSFPMKDSNRTGFLEENSLLQVAPVNRTTRSSELDAAVLSQKPNQGDEIGNVSLQNKSSSVISNKKKRKHSRSRNLLSERRDGKEQNLKILIGSLGSKSNKVLYIRAILKFISQHSDLSKLLMWTPATTHVASLYAAADVYVINAQGVGETFGRVTIEAMAFGLPVLGTDAGGTKEIVEDNITGLLHPVGREGKKDLAQNILYLLTNPSVRKNMGARGRQLVQDKYLKNHMYRRFAEVLVKCMKIK